MPTRKGDLQGSVPDQCETALLLVDVINPLAFPEASQLRRHLPAMSRSLRRLKERAKAAGVPVIYVNDNFGRWRSDFRAQVNFCLSPESGGRELVRQLRRDEDDYFVLKPKHSGFFDSPLDTLLRFLCARCLIITGLAGNSCVLFTASEAHMRDYELFVPRDCMASNSLKENREAEELMKRFLNADTRPSPQLKFARGRQGKLSA